MENPSNPSLRVVIPFQTSRKAEIAYNSLRVDHEPKRSHVTRTMAVEENNLVVLLVAQEARQLRLSVNTFFDHLALVEKTIDQFSLDNPPTN